VKLLNTVVDVLPRDACGLAMNKAVDTSRLGLSAGRQRLEPTVQVRLQLQLRREAAMLQNGHANALALREAFMCEQCWHRAMLADKHRSFSLLGLLSC
jgi:hypothetical protein